MSTATLEYVETRTSDVPGDSAHIVMVPPDQSDESPQAYVLRARIEGFQVTALCGHTWFPQRDPKPLPVCAACLNVYQHDPNGFGDRDELPDS